MLVPMLTLPILLSVIVGGVLLLVVLHYSLAWHRPTKSGARLPPGSFGWPLIGESLHFSRNPQAYVAARAKRYGSIFKSSLFLQPVIVGSSPEFAKFVISNPRVFAIKFPENIRKLTGAKAFAHKDGPEHMAIKKIITKAIVPEALRTKVNALEAIVLDNLAVWAAKGTVNGFESTANIVLDTSLVIMLGVTNIGSTPEGREALKQLQVHERSMLSVPVNLPGTQFNKGLKAKAALTAYFKFLLGKRKNQENNQDHQENDVLGVLCAAQEDPQARREVKDLSDDAVADTLSFVWFAAYATTRATLTWILKFLVDHPDVSRRIQAEQEEICKSSDLSAEKPGLTWDDTRKMVYTSKFFHEIQRTSSILNVVFRKATQDVEFDGYLIPKGWGVFPTNSNIHEDHAIYPDPQSFDPDRFDVAPKPFTYLPFSAGTHMCPGLETVKLISLIYTHHLTTTYAFESAEPDTGVEFTPVPTPRGGYPIIIRRRSSVQKLE